MTMVFRHPIHPARHGGTFVSAASYIYKRPLWVWIQYFDSQGQRTHRGMVHLYTLMKGGARSQKWLYLTQNLGTILPISQLLVCSLQQYTETE